MRETEVRAVLDRMSDALWKVRVKMNTPTPVSGAPDWTAPIHDAIEAAWAHAEAGRRELAALSFAVARRMVHDLCTPTLRDAAVQRAYEGFRRERERYADIVAALGPGPAAPAAAPRRPLLILSDSLGLPRPDAMAGPHKGAEICYPWLLAKALPQRPVQSHSQRFYSTQSVLDLLQQRPDLGVEGDVVLHVGLNDCANRMFLEPERLALDFLPPAVKERIVTFAQKNRAAILRHLPPHHYVNPVDFARNLQEIVTLLRARKAERILLTTIILPPSRTWPATPGLNRNFATYNLAIMTAAEELGATLFDFDRLVWQAGIDPSPLIEDGMHLSETGHRLFAAGCKRLLS